jgi:transcriptional regulator with XRE-family HTH domain
MQMMIARQDVRGCDVRLARLFLGLTCRQVADGSRVNEATVRRFEGEMPVQYQTRFAILKFLVGQGARFMGRGDVRTPDGRPAPSKEITGVLHGARLRRARRRLGLTLEDVAGRSAVGIASLRRLEAGHDLQAHPTADFCAVFTTLQLVGYSFAPARHGGVSGDRMLIAPQKPKREPRDRSRYHTKAIRFYHGVPRNLPEEADDTWS